MNPVAIRAVDPERDAAACAAIYAPYVEASAPSFRGACTERGGSCRSDRAGYGHAPLARRRARRGGAWLRIRLPAPGAARLSLGGGRLGLRCRDPTSPGRWGEPLRGP